MNRMYIKGRAFEYRIKEILEKDGWIVFRNPKSSFPDLIAIKSDSQRMFPEVLFVECKVNGDLSNEEIVKAQLLVDKTKADFKIAIRKSGRITWRDIS